MAKLPFPPFSSEALQQFAESASQLLPSSATREDFHQNISLLMQSALAKMDLVTREEFDAQTAVLEKTRTKLEQLEQELEQLSKKVDQ